MIMKEFRSLLIKLVFVLFVVYAIYSLNGNSSNTKSVHKELSFDHDLLEIYYFDVGEADSTLIRYKNHNILIDAGNTVDGVLLVPYLKELGIDHFEYLIATHAHEDHIGGMARVIYNFPIDHLYIPDHKAEWKSYSNLLKAANTKNVDLETPNIYDTFSLDELEFTILWIGNSDDFNENSIVLKLRFFDTCYLFMGDATGDVEREILEEDISCNVLKVAHHGSKYSSIASFISKVHPEYSIISVAEGNEYGHPHQVVLDKLERINSTIYRTDIHHTILLKSDGEAIRIEFIDQSFNGGDLS